MESRILSKSTGNVVWWRKVSLLCGLAIFLCGGETLAQQSTELAGAGGGDFPPGTTYNGVAISGMRFGFGIDLAVSGGSAGTFEFTLLGLSATGQPQIITIEGTAAGGSGTAGTGATVLGTTTVDMGDGSPPATGLPFMMTVTTGGSGPGTLELVVDVTTIPPATVTTGSLAVAACRPDLPALVTDTLCAGGVGLIGHHWISLPSYTNLRTAKDLCVAVGPTAISVSQKFPDTASGSSSGLGTWTYDCNLQTCTPGSISTPPFEAGCSAADCFCINPGEGYEVVSSSPTSFQVKGCESRVPIVLPPGGDTYLVSVPIQTNLHTFQDLALAIGLPNTGVARGTVIGLNGCTGVVVACSAGTFQCNSLILVPGQAYRVRYLNPNGTTFVNPTTSTAQCPPPC